MGRKWVLVENKSNKVVVWLCVLLGQESVMHDDEEIIVFYFRSKKREIIDEVCGKANKTKVASQCKFINVSEFNDISNPLQNMDNMVVILDVELGDRIQTKSNFIEESEQKAFWLNCIQDKTKNNVICITSTESDPMNIIEKCGNPGHMLRIGAVEGNLNDPKKFEDDKRSAKTALQKAHKFWHSLNGPNVLLSALEEAQKITNSSKPGAHPKSWPPEFKNEGIFPFDVNLLKHNDDDSIEQALEAFKALFEYPDQQGIDLCEKTKVPGVWRCKGCRRLTVKHIADVIKKAGIRCTYNPDVETQEINLPTMPGVVFLWRLASFLLEGLDGWNGSVTLEVDDKGTYLHLSFTLPIPNPCYHDFIASYHVRRYHQGAGVLAFENLLCCKLPELSDSLNGGDRKHVNYVNYLGRGGNYSKRGPRLVPLIRHEFRDKQIYLSWISKKFKKAKED